MNTFDFISTLAIVCGPFLGLAFNQPQWLLRIFQPVLAACVLTVTAVACWTLGVNQAHTALAPFIGPNASKEAALALASLGIPPHVHLLFMGFVFGLLISFKLAHHRLSAQ